MPTRSELIQKAASLSVGDPERKALLAKLKMAAGSLASFLELVIDNFTSEAMGHIAGHLRKAGPQITDIRVEGPNIETFLIRGKPGRINAFADIGGKGATSIEVTYKGKQDATDFASNAFFAIPDKLLS